VRKAVHDLNNQLAVILNYTNFVIEDTAADDPRRAGPRAGPRAAKRARDVTLQMLAELPPAD